MHTTYCTYLRFYIRITKLHTVSTTTLKSPGGLNVVAHQCMCLDYLQYVVELGFELKVRFGFQDDSFQGLLQHLNPSLSLLTGVCDAHVLPLTAESLLFSFVHL